jgi:hypothetical protein
MKKKENEIGPIIAIYTRNGYPSSQVNCSIDKYRYTPVNSIILSGPNGHEGGIVYNDPQNHMFDSNGKYVGDSNWVKSLQDLIANTNIQLNQIYISLSNSAISTLAAMTPVALDKVMTFLKTNGIAGIDMDCENWGQPGGLDPMACPCQIVTLATTKAGLALTAAPYRSESKWQDWCSFVTNNKGSLSWLNIQCYDGGFRNNPVQWFTSFKPPVPVLAGFEAIPGTDKGALKPEEIKMQLESWQAELPTKCLTGAFIWDYGIIVSGKYTVNDYALAIFNGLTKQQ